MIAKRGFFIFMIFILVSPGLAQINRPFEPVILSGDSIPEFTGLEVDKLFLYKYQMVTDTWQMVPFQIDEVNPEVNDSLKYFDTTDSLYGIFDADDELVFLTADIGDRADSTQWLDIPESNRLELEFDDPVNNVKGYLYLYYSSHITDPIPDKYEMAYDSDNDRVSSANYELGFIEREGDDINTTGQLNDVMIKSGTGIDIFDRLKVRAIGWWLFTIIYLDENSIEAGYAYAKVGPVRVIRNMFGAFNFEALSTEEKFTQTVFFYPWSGAFELVDIPLGQAKNVGAQVFTVRTSWDLNKNAIGMKFYDAHNQAGILIDGNKDNIDTTVTPDNLNWTMATGEQGTLFNVFYVPPFGDIKDLYYYEDNSGEGYTGDNPRYDSKDTGDSSSYGDSGFSLDENIEKYMDGNSVFNFIYYNYFLPPDFSVEQAAELFDQIKNPITCESRLQKNPMSSVMTDNSITTVPESYLLQNYPNPFNASTIVSFNLSEEIQTELRIYDSLGRLIYTLAEGTLQAGSHKFLWNGTDNNGGNSPSGVYFCRISAGQYNSTIKLLLIR